MAKHRFESIAKCGRFRNKVMRDAFDMYARRPALVIASSMPRVIKWRILTQLFPNKGDFFVCSAIQAAGRLPVKMLPICES
jgi:hypothetical protein